MSDDCYFAEYEGVADKAGLEKLRGSKYIQANAGDTYKQVKEELQSGKLVLFSGTGCQVNGLKAFLGADYENLLCVDVICHGIPSPALWKKYAQYQEQKNGGKLKYVSFRYKDDSWKELGMQEILNRSSQYGEKTVYISKSKDSYMKMFLSDYCLRPSCYSCIAKQVKLADLTIADFWGIDDVAPEMNDGHGTSLVLLRTDKGREAFEKISDEFRLKEVSYEDGVRANSAEYSSCSKPPQRDIFFYDMHNLNFKELESKYTVPLNASLQSRLKSKIKGAIKLIIRKTGWRTGGKSNDRYGLLFKFHIGTSLKQQ